ncbi:uncharacterized protein BYT42DRAFT_582704 [Radiomyces spectabilis]|uniref:uncharacterized protein n=1 Tax=Radiomyces spectabilis TaxID=64574 RepID=UPI00221F3BC6|nr:uncharacterized protein BYT42DRAFT_582704 [Radiomyces spectabilis]KAI8370517.1 hypothetical protein BYT42DRAFT_582704 [Radiomyces spectabilis]
MMDSIDLSFLRSLFTSASPNNKTSTENENIKGVSNKDTRPVNSTANTSTTSNGAPLLDGNPKDLPSRALDRSSNLGTENSTHANKPNSGYEAASVDRAALLSHAMPASGLISTTNWNHELNNVSAVNEKPNTIKDESKATTLPVRFSSEQRANPTSGDQANAAVGSTKNIASIPSSSTSIQPIQSTAASASASVLKTTPPPTVQPSYHNPQYDQLLADVLELSGMKAPSVRPASPEPIDLSTLIRDPGDHPKQTYHRPEKQLKGRNQKKSKLKKNQNQVKANVPRQNLYPNQNERRKNQRKDQNKNQRQNQNQNEKKADAAKNTVQQVQPDILDVANQIMGRPEKRAFIPDTPPVPTSSQPTHGKKAKLDMAHSPGSGKAPNSRASVPCRFWLKGKCKSGEQCPFQHEGDPFVSVCRFFKTNSCVNGDQCPMSHDLRLEPCRFYHVKGVCDSGEMCPFSHEPLTPTLLRRLHVMTGPCRFYHFKGYCNSGDQCLFSHTDISEAERRKLEKTLLPCKFYHSHGSCAAGDDCFYLHDEIQGVQVCNGPYWLTCTFFLLIG